MARVSYQAVLEARAGTRSGRQPWAAGGGTLAAGAKLKVLDRSGEYVQVRDEQGNDGWVPANAL